MNSQEKIDAARVQALHALRTAQAPGHVVRLEDMELVTFATMRGDYMTSFANRHYPDYLIFVHKQGHNIYTQVTKLIDRFASHGTDPLPGL